MPPAPAPAQESLVPKNCTATGAGLERALLQQESEFIIQAVDKSLKPLLTGGAAFKCLIRGPAGPTVTIQDLNNGQYRATYKATTSGVYTIEVRTSGLQIMNSPFTMNAGVAPSTGAKSTCTGDGLAKAVAGVESQFVIQGIDHQGRAKVTGGEEFLIRLTCPDGSTLNGSTADNGNGSYVAMFTPTQRGHHTMAVTLRGQPLIKSPFAVQVEPGATDGPNSFVITQSVMQRVSAGKELVFAIRARDAFGNECIKGGHEFRARSVGQKDVVDGTVWDNDDGTYKVTMVPRTSGPFTVEMTSTPAVRRKFTGNKEAQWYPLKGVDPSNVHAHSNPFTVSVDSSGTAPSVCAASGRALEQATAGIPAVFMIQSKDEFGNMRDVGKDSYQLILLGDDGSPTVDGGPFDYPPKPNAPGFSFGLNDNGNGKYKATYTVEKSGNYKLQVSCAGAEIAGSPFSVIVSPGKTVGACCVANGDGLNQTVAGLPSSFVVQCNDNFGNNKMAGGDRFSIVLTLKSPADEPEGGEEDAEPTILQGTATDNNDGTFHCQYSAFRSGLYDMHISTGEQQIEGSPFTLICNAGAISPSKCTVLGDAISSVTTKERSFFTIESRDNYGNRLKYGSSGFLTKLTGPSAEKTIMQDNQDGTYSVEFSVSVSGVFQLGITLGRSPVAFSPYNVQSTKEGQAPHQVNSLNSGVPMSYGSKLAPVKPIQSSLAKSPVNVNNSQNMQTMLKQARGDRPSIADRPTSSSMSRSKVASPTIKSGMRSTSSGRRL